MSFGDHPVAALLFHDRTPVAWFIVAAYFSAAAAAFWASRAARKRDRLFWIGAALLLLFLGLNKELDLQTLLTTEGRLLAQRGGWYDERRLVQGLFLLALAGASLLTIVGLTKWLRKSPAQVKAGAVGIILLFTYILMRAGSFHHIDDWVKIRLAGVRSGWWLELAGAVVIGLSALAYRLRSKQR